MKLRKQQGQVLRNVSLTRKKNVDSHLLNTYEVPDTVRILHYTSRVTKYTTAEEIKAQKV